MATKKITELTAAGALDGTELVEMVQSSSSKKGLLSAITTFVMTYLAPTTHAATAKTSLASADEFALVDSAASNVLKKITFANLWAAVQSAIKGSPSTLYLTTDTYANIVAGYPAASYSGASAKCTDLNMPSGCVVISDGTNWNLTAPINYSAMQEKWINFGGTAATYSQTGTTVTVTQASHGLPATDFNGATIYLTQSTGALLSGNFTNFQYVNANSFTCVSTVSQSTSGNLGANTAETFCPTLCTVSTSLRYPYFVSPTVITRASVTGNNKTAKIYFGDYAATSSITTNTAGATSYSNLSPNRVEILSGTKLMMAGATTFITAYTGTTVRASSQLANAADWQCLWPERTQLQLL